MKLCFIGNVKSIHVKRWLKWFLYRGHEVHLITSNYGEIEGAKIYKIGKDKKGSLFNFIRKMLQTRKLVRQIRPDILHAHYLFGCGTFAAFANYHPLVVTAWGDDILKDAHKNPIMKYLVKFVIERADYVTFFSEYLLKNVNKITNRTNNMMVIRPWVFEKYRMDSVNEKLIEKFRSRLGITSESFVIFSPRNIQPIYRTEKIVNSIPLVIKNYPEALFVFLKGHDDNKYYNYIKCLIGDLNIKKNVRIIKEWLNEKDMIALYKIADIIISLPKRDQFSACVREAMMFGAVPIIGDLEIYRDELIDGKNAYFVSGEDDKEISNKILYCIRQSSSIEKMRKINEIKIKSIIKKIERENKLEKMDNIYKSLLDK